MHISGKKDRYHFDQFLDGNRRIRQEKEETKGRYDRGVELFAGKPGCRSGLKA